MICLHQAARSGNEPVEVNALKTGGVSMISSGDRQPIPILFVLPNFRAGGAERVILTLLKLLDRTRFAPELVVFDGQGEFADLLPQDVMLHDLGAARLRSAFVPLLRVIRKRRPALVFSSHSYVNLALLAGRSLLPGGTKVVVREPSTPSKNLPDTNFGPLLDLGYRAFFRRADRVICLNREVEKDLSSRYGVAVNRLVLLPNPVAAEALRNSAVPLVRDAGTGRRLVAAGRLTRAKGFDNLLRIMLQTADDVFLTIYGDGPEEEVLKGLCRELGLEERVRFAGFQKNLAPAYAGADAVVVSSRWEGFPNVVLEALACGTPVISTREAGGVVDIVKDEPGTAITLASSKAEFIDAVLLVREDKHTLVRPSLLPPRFDERQVVKLFERVVDRVVTCQ